MGHYELNIVCENNTDNMFLYEITLSRNEVSFVCIVKDNKEIIDNSNFCKKMECAFYQLFECHERYLRNKGFFRRLFYKYKSLF